MSRDKKRKKKNVIVRPPIRIVKLIITISRDGTKDVGKDRGAWNSLIQPKLVTIIYDFEDQA